MSDREELERQIEAVRQEMVRKLIIPQHERFTAWLESRDIHAVTFLVGYGGQIDREWTWPELMQEWYREMEAFS